MATFTVDLTSLPLADRRAVIETIRDDNAAKLALAKVRQAKIAKLHREAVRPGTTKDGIGPMSLAMDSYFLNYFRLEYGQEIMSDDEFVAWLKKRGEWFHVSEVGTKVQVGWTGQQRRRFKKVYETKTEAV